METRQRPPAPGAAQEEKRGANVEVYGFVAWIATGLTFVAYVLWAFLSEEWLEWLGVTYYPSKHFLFYTAFNWAFSTPLDARTTLTDEHTVAPALGTREGATLVEDLLLRREGHRLAEEAGLDRDRYRRNVRGEVPSLCDLPITTVNSLLFPSKQK
ncbi:uncharacterized protein ACA1_391080 [Acanthamoeba castellanii str. Neff]|uniref:PIG-P domain-containing protein n=1 Tax=Acanthamoeba castellanii (strain ATCC 30010 / Neff) TaxID=1257118 RepID=L8GRI9_ACACF|nr:uncharacterized protein ACA1_391080 [Acanthamoeba castellanii str. Neff]ELR14751.1 hypothetical protein ACA1_391080 [Acanthamoeba castellanii str. Neff]